MEISLSLRLKLITPCGSTDLQGVFFMPTGFHPQCVTPCRALTSGITSAYTSQCKPCKRSIEYVYEVNDVKRSVTVSLHNVCPSSYRTITLNVGGI